jgi:hypothetical protein
MQHFFDPALSYLFIFKGITLTIFFPLFGVSLQAFCDLEPIYTYEGTYDINSLVTGREITGFASFRPAAMSKRSRL